MDTSTTSINSLQDRISEIAKQKLENDITEAFHALYRNPILRRLKIGINGVQKTIVSFDNTSLFRMLHMHQNKVQAMDDGEQKTNWPELYSSLLSEYIEAETNNLISGIERMNKAEAMRKEEIEKNEALNKFIAEKQQHE